VSTVAEWKKIRGALSRRLEEELTYLDYDNSTQRLVPFRSAQYLTLGLSVQRANPAPVEALEQRQKETLQRLVDGIVWLDRDEGKAGPGSPPGPSC
jgi:hypothetical protein